MVAAMAMTIPGKAVTFASRKPWPPNSFLGSFPNISPMTSMNTGAKAIINTTFAGSRSVRRVVVLRIFLKTRMSTPLPHRAARQGEKDVFK